MEGPTLLMLSLSYICHLDVKSPSVIIKRPNSACNTLILVTSSLGKKSSLTTLMNLPNRFLITRHHQIQRTEISTVLFFPLSTYTEGYLEIKIKLGFSSNLETSYVVCNGTKQVRGINEQENKRMNKRFNYL